MKRSSARSAFTLVEMLMVMVIIAIVAGLIVGVAGLANGKAMRSRSTSEIQGLSTAAERYKSDNGTYPRSPGVTEPTATNGGKFLDARASGDATQDIYKKASLYLYEQLSGDFDDDGRLGDNNPAGTAAAGTPATIYFEFKPTAMGGITSTNPIGTAKAVKYLQDPYGFSYGYSTVGSWDEEDFRQRAEKDPTGHAARTSTPRGYNETFDLWSTIGTTVDPPTDLSRQRWVKNW